MEKSKNLFPKWGIPSRSCKPRDTGLTHANDRTMGIRHVEDLCESLGDYIDIVKMRGWPLHTKEFVKKKMSIYKKYQIDISAGDYFEYAVSRGSKAVDYYLEEAQELGFTVIEVCNAIIVIPLNQKIELIKHVQKLGFKALCEVGKKGLNWAKNPPNAKMYIDEIRKSLDAGSWKVMIESQGIAEFVDEIRKDIIYDIVAALGLKDIILEAPDEKAFAWYISEFGPEVNLCVNADHVFEVEHYRRGLRGRREVFGIVATYMEG